MKWPVLVIAAVAPSLCVPQSPPTFEQRWEPVQELNGGIKGDRLKPLHQPAVQSRQTRMA